MHTEVNDHIELVKRLYPDYFINKKVLEVGSLDINGSIRHHFENCDYVGIDLGEGNGVDIISPVHEFNSDVFYDVVVSTEMLEHDKYWAVSLFSMYEKLKSGGLFILTCAAPSRKEHGTLNFDADNSPFTNDYYRNISIGDFSDVLPPQLFIYYCIKYERDMQDLGFFGIKI